MEYQFLNLQRGTVSWFKKLGVFVKKFGRIVVFDLVNLETVVMKLWFEALRGFDQDSISLMKYTLTNILQSHFHKISFF